MKTNILILKLKIEMILKNNLKSKNVCSHYFHLLNF